MPAARSCMPASIGVESGVSRELVLSSEPRGPTGVTSVGPCRLPGCLPRWRQDGIAKDSLIGPNRATCVGMSAARRRGRPEGIVVRHSRHCATNRGAGCDCRPGYQAQVFSQRDRKTIRKTFSTLSDARAWRAESHSALRLGTLRAPTRTTIAVAAAEWLSAAKAEVVRTRSGSPYKPSALRS
jgi:hypothetical protein